MQKKDCNRAIFLNPTDHSPYSNRAIIHMKLGDYKSALSDLNEAVKLKSNDLRVFLNRSVIKENLGDIKGACSDARKAVEFGYEDENNKSWIKAKC